LHACHIDTVAMQATGVYSIPFYDILTAHGIRVVLVNAQIRKEKASVCVTARRSLSD
jgi:transposase